MKKKVAAWVIVCATVVAGFEGLRTSTYFDVGGVPTVCFGETKNINPGDKYTPAQCREMLGNRLVTDFGPGVDRCVRHALPDTRKAAYTSFAYNVGVGAFCRSSVAKRENAGDVVGACDALLLYNKITVAGVLVYSPGLARRRQQERQLCLAGQ